ncbi:16707_t:CDS:1, partial [Racocetra persica]
ITCDRNAEQIVQAVITTESNIIQTFMIYISTQQSYSGLSINDKLQYDGKFNWKITRIIEEIKRARQIGSKTYVLHIGVSNT